MKHKILLVEDNVPIRENTAELLELSGYKVLTAGNGKEGLDISIKEHPDLILCDIKMPVMDGYHLLEHIRHTETLVHLPFIFFTATCERKEIAYGMNMGANDYIVKPFSGTDLLNKLEKQLSLQAITLSGQNN